MKCLRCPMVELAAGAGARHEHVCPRCSGRMLPGEDAARLLFDELSVNRAWMHELLRDGRSRLACPLCTAAMSTMRIHGVNLECCGHCGAMYLDKGELSGLTGQPEVVVATPPPEAAPVVVAEPPGGRRHAVLLMVPSLSVDVAIEAFERAGVRTAIDARYAVTTAIGGVVAIGLTFIEASNLASCLTSLIHDAAAVNLDSVFLPKQVRRTTTVVIDGEHLSLPREQGQLSRDEVLGVAAASLPAAPSAAVREPTPPRPATRLFGTTTAPLEPLTPTRAPTTTDVVEILTASSRYRLDQSTWVPSPSARTLTELVGQLDRWMPSSALRHRGVMAVRNRQPLPLLGSPRMLDHELQWLLWRPQQQ